MSKFSTHIEFPVDVEYDYHKGTPGKLSGPPEKCYPAEPSWVEIISVKVRGVELLTLTEDELTTLEQEIEDKLTEKAAADQQDYWDNIRKDAKLAMSSLEQEYDLATYGDWMSDENQ